MVSILVSFIFTSWFLGGRSFAMKPDSDDKFVVGTEEGEIYLCTTHFSSKALKTYSAHNTPVQSICWNTFLTNVFITCASEMLVKIWSKDMSQPMFRFDLQSQVTFLHSSFVLTDLLRYVMLAGLLTLAQYLLQSQLMERFISLTCLSTSITLSVYSL